MPRKLLLRLHAPNLTMKYTPSYPNPELADLRRTADQLLQDRAIFSTPLFVRLIHFIAERSTDYRYPLIDRIWLDTRNEEVLMDCMYLKRQADSQLLA